MDNVPVLFIVTVIVSLCTVCYTFVVVTVNSDVFCCVVFCFVFVF